MNVNIDVAASSRKSIRVVAVVLFSSSLFLSAVSAQFSSGFPGQMNLPQNDFTWTWGNRSSAGRGMDDFSMFGDDSGFRCDLTGKLRVGSRMSRMDMRDLESSIRSSMSRWTSVSPDSGPSQS